MNKTNRSYMWTQAGVRRSRAKSVRPPRPKGFRRKAWVMLRWKWFARRDGQIDVIGPATTYGDRRGVYAPGAAPVESEPTWDGTTRILPAVRPSMPLMTLGQRSRGSDPGSAES